MVHINDIIPLMRSIAAELLNCGISKPQKIRFCGYCHCFVSVPSLGLNLGNCGIASI
jgi:hypothetical protein